MKNKAIVLDANARKYLPALLAKRSVKSEPAMAVLVALQSIVRLLEYGVNAGLQTQALQRVAIRDADDWPVLACAMTIGCPVWTEDADFFAHGWQPGHRIALSCIWAGSGLATGIGAKTT